MKRTGSIHLGCVGLLVLCLPLASAAGEAQAPPPSVAEGTYVVKKGDTLWGIAKQLLNDPVIWPRIFERNPFITDPNRIFPGDTLVLPGQAPAPAPVAEAPKPVPAPQQAEAQPAKAPAPAPPAPEARPEIEAVKQSPVPPASQQAMACSPVIAREERAAAVGTGSIIRSEDGRLLLSLENRIAVGLDEGRSASVGDRLAVVRFGLQVIHPRTRQVLGRILDTLGVVEVVEVQGRTLQGRIVYACQAMNVGDRMVQFTPVVFPEDKVAQPASRKVKATILDSPRPGELYAQQHLVFLDAGTGQGIGIGDVFAVERPIPPAIGPTTGQTFPLPPERLGEAVVIRVTEGTATAVITASAKEIHRGDLAILRNQIQP